MLKRILIFPAILLIKIYQILISPLFPSACRHLPTCSNYAEEAIRIHGFFKGAYLAAKRLLVCHPWRDGGYDPVPNKK